MRTVTAEDVLALSRRADRTGDRQLADDLYVTAWRNFHIGVHTETDGRNPTPTQMSDAARKYADKTLLTEVF